MLLLMLTPYSLSVAFIFGNDKVNLLAYRCLFSFLLTVHVDKYIKVTCGRVGNVLDSILSII